MFGKVMILSASAGSGHITAARALETAFTQLDACEQVRHEDMLDYTSKLFRGIYSKAYIELVNKRPEVLGWLYDYLDKPFKNERSRIAMNKLNTRRFVRMLEEYDPDIVICTHFLPSEVISHLKMKGREDVPMAIVVTDMDLHAMWLCRDDAHYFVALEETQQHLLELGVPEPRVSITGIPVDPKFAEKKDKAEMREKFGLHPEKTTILLSTGGFGVGPAEHLVRSVLGMRNPVQMVAICGRNEDLKVKLDAMRADVPDDHHVDLHVTGYTKQMDEYMAASDLLLGKPGGLTTCEALAKGLVPVIVNPIPGQEERNADHLLEKGAAIRCNNLPVLGWKIDQLLDDPARFARMQSAVREIAKPNAATDIVEQLLAMRAENRLPGQGRPLLVKGPDGQRERPGRRLLKAIKRSSGRVSNQSGTGAS